ncbi:Integrin alpha-IIb-like [Homarus americanus]|uniref:Integrin alpha-IIb-like n=1 Tax=Homarus americanus TaxID=6706 RepID=A0A8J5TGP7_HOMAM|nr:Integrin alpha-IIb-like [Homarus americanus]
MVRAYMTAFVGRWEGWKRRKEGRKRDRNGREEEERERDRGNKRIREKDRQTEDHSSVSERAMMTDTENGGGGRVSCLQKWALWALWVVGVGGPWMVEGYNLSPSHSRIMEGPPGAHFGFSVALWWDKDDQKRIAVGAPRGKNSTLGMGQRPLGNIFLCTVTDDVKCFPDERLPMASKAANIPNLKTLENAMFGYSVALDDQANSVILGGPYAFYGEGVVYNKPFDGGLGSMNRLKDKKQQPSTIDYSDSNEGWATILGNFDNINTIIATSTVHYGNYTGRVSFYPKKLILHKPPLLSLYGTEVGAQFGYCLGSGDVDGDGAADLLVGAPLAPGEHAPDAGKIWVYLSPLITKVEASFFPDEIRGFGFSMDGGIDVDGNGYPDLIIGAVESDRAILVRSKPVIRLVGGIRFKKQDMIVEDEKDCIVEAAGYRSFKAVCFELQVDITYDTYRELNNLSTLQSGELIWQVIVVHGRWGGTSRVDGNTSIPTCRQLQFVNQISNKLICKFDAIGADEVVNFTLYFKYDSVSLLDHLTNQATDTLKLDLRVTSDSDGDPDTRNNQYSVDVPVVIRATLHTKGVTDGEHNSGGELDSVPGGVEGGERGPAEDLPCRQAGSSAPAQLKFHVPLYRSKGDLLTYFMDQPATSPSLTCQPLPINTLHLQPTNNAQPAIATSMPDLTDTTTTTTPTNMPDLADTTTTNMPYFAGTITVSALADTMESNIMNDTLQHLRRRRQVESTVTSQVPASPSPRSDDPQPEKCEVELMEMGSSVTITFTSYLVTATIHKMPYKTLEVKTWMTGEVDQENSTISDPKVAASTQVYLLRPPDTGFFAVPLWALLLAVGLAVLLIIFIITGLWMLGFFKRKRPYVEAKRQSVQTWEEMAHMSMKEDTDDG